jgi:hypothetical protein
MINIKEFNAAFRSHGFKPSRFNKKNQFRFMAYKRIDNNRPVLIIIRDKYFFCFQFIVTSNYDTEPRKEGFGTRMHKYQTVRDIKDTLLMNKDYRRFVFNKSSIS